MNIPQPRAAPDLRLESLGDQPLPGDGLDAIAPGHRHEGTDRISFGPRAGARLSAGLSLSAFVVPEAADAHASIAIGRRALVIADGIYSLE
jgi:hypothetical protein